MSYKYLRLSFEIRLPILRIQSLSGWVKRTMILEREGGCKGLVV
jgi:hypothetical protein